MYEFLADLDEFFCENYANYSQLCVLEGYKMPLMQTTTTDEYGRSFSYTLPAETMRLSLQEKKAEILASLKPKLTDLTFSFSFQPLSVWKRLRNKFSKRGFVKVLQSTLLRCSSTVEELGKRLTVRDEIWKGICKGTFFPTKNLVLSIALLLECSVEDCQAMLAVGGYAFDFTIPKDVVTYYLLLNKIYNADMVRAAFEEYKIRNLFIE